MNRADIANILTTNSGKWFKGRVCHPEQSAIERMILYLQQVLLPNYFHVSEDGTVEDCLKRLQNVMSSQIHRAVFQKCLEKDGTVETRDYAESKANQVITQLPQVQQFLYEDVVETYESDPAASGHDEVILTYPGLFALLVYRTAHEMVACDIPLLPRMMTEYAHKITGIDLHPGASIGTGIMIDHGTGIVIGETAVVGNHVKIYQGVTLGALYFPRDEQGEFERQTKRHPTVEDYVVLYSNATVLGGNTVIGHHSVIGSNAWVTESVVPYSKVVYRSESVVKTRIASDYSI